MLRTHRKRTGGVRDIEQEVSEEGAWALGEGNGPGAGRK